MLTKSKNVKANSLQVVETDSVKPSYILANIKEKKLPIQVDNGADYSIISNSLVQELNLELTELDKPISLQGIRGPGFKANMCTLVMLQFIEGEIIHPFIIIEDPSCPCLVGIDFLKRFNAQIDYVNDTIQLETKQMQMALQLHTYKETKELCAEDDSDNSDDDEDLDREAVINFLHAKPDIKEDSYEVGKSPDPRMSGLLQEFDDLFVNSFTEIPGVEFEKCTIILKENAAPVFARMPRYSPQQREVIKEEIEKMLKNGVIEPSRSP